MSSVEFGGFSIDSRTIRSSDCFIALEGPRFDGHDYIGNCCRQGVRVFIADKKRRSAVQKNVPEGSVYYVRNTRESLARLAAAYKNSIFSTVVGITGSSGKTTARGLVVSALSGKYNVHTARKNFNNDIGLPLTILEAPQNTHVIVLEMGMNHSGEIRALSRLAQPLLGAVTNIGYAHIGNLGSLEAVADAKAEIFEGVVPHGYALLNRDDPFYSRLKARAVSARLNVLDFGLADLEVLEDRGLDGFRLRYRGREFLFPLAGGHNLSNLAASLAIAQFFKVDTDELAGRMSETRAVSGRAEIILKTVTIINDSYNSNPSSLKAGLDLLSKSSGRRVAVLSDMLELGGQGAGLHREAGEFIAEKRPADILLACGDLSRETVKAAQKGRFPDARWFAGRQELIAGVLETVQPGDTVFVKASRGMNLDEVVRILSDRY